MKIFVTFVLAWLLGSAAQADPALYSLTKDVAYGTDPLQIMDVYQPVNASSAPLLVIIHGGGWVGGGKETFKDVADYFASNGYVVADIDYRLLSSGVNMFPTQITDVSSAISWLKANATTYGIDSTRVAALGASVGGYLALEAANQAEVNALVDFYGPTDLTDPIYLAATFDRMTNEQIMEMYLGFSIQDNPPVFTEASPLPFVSASNPPTLIFHGAADTVVPVTQSQSLSDALIAKGVPCILNIIPNAGHGFLTNKNFDSSAYRLQALTFLNAALSSPAVPPTPPTDPAPPTDPTPITPPDPSPVTPTPPADPTPVTPPDPTPVTPSPPADPTPVTPPDPTPVTPSPPADPTPVTPTDPTPVAPTPPADPTPVTPPGPSPITPGPATDPTPITRPEPAPVAPPDPSPVAPPDPGPIVPTLPPATLPDPDPVSPSSPVEPAAPPVSSPDPGTEIPVAPSDPAPVSPTDPAPVARPFPAGPGIVLPVLPTAPASPADPSPIVAPTPAAPVDDLPPVIRAGPGSH